MSDFFSILKRHKEILVLLLLILVSLISIGVNTDGGLMTPKEAGFTVFSVFQRGVNGIGSFFSNTLNSINELSELTEAYSELQDKLIEYEEIERNIDELKIENRYLREQLGFSRTSEFSNIPAEVIGKDPGNTFNSIVIDKGSSSGIERNMPVVALQDGYHGLVGKVVEVGQFSSIVMPVYDESAFVSARLQESRYEGLITGSGYSNSLLKMDYIKKIAREEIEYGDFVITSGMNSIFPKGLYIGRVTAIEGKEWDTSLQLEIEPVVDFTRVEYVIVLQRGEE